MGSNDAGLTVLNKCPKLDRLTAETARALGLSAHVVGGWQVWVPYEDNETRKKKWRRKNVRRQVLHAAADVEGHEGTDSRWGCIGGEWVLPEVFSCSWLVKAGGSVHTDFCLNAGPLPGVCYPCPPSKPVETAEPRPYKLCSADTCAPVCFECVDRMYLLDLARAFPPEDPNATPHLSGMLR